MAELPNIQPFVDTTPALESNTITPSTTEVHPEIPSIVQNIRDNTYTPQSLMGSDPLTAGLNNNRRKRNSLNELGRGGTTQSAFRNDGFRLVDAYDELSDGSFISKFDNYLQNSDNEQRFAKDQSTTTKWANGLGKFATKTGAAIVGGTLGTAYGLGEALFTGNFEAIQDNQFTNELDDFDKRMNRNLPNHYTKQERDAGFFDSLGSANFWANDFLGGLSFTAGAIVSEGIWAAATGGTSLIAAAGKTGLRASKLLGKVKAGKQVSNRLINFTSKGIPKAKSNVIAAGRGASALNTIRMGYTSAGFEAGIEARHFEAEQRDLFNDHFDGLGTKPTNEQITAFENEVGIQKNTLFAVNMGLVGASNVLMLGQIYNIKNPLKGASKAVNKTMFGSGSTVIDGVRKPIQRNVTQRIAGVTYNSLKNPVREGVFEEGLQSVAGNAGGGIVESMYNIDKDTLNYMESFYEGMSETYGTKEGWKEVGLGMLIGAFSGGGISAMNKQNPFSSIIDAGRKESKTVNNQVTEMEKAGGASAIYGSYTEIQNKVALDIAKTNQMMKSAAKGVEAEQKGDLALAEQARNETYNAQMMYASSLDMVDELQEDFFYKLDALTEEQFSKDFGIKPTEVENKKRQLKNEYVAKKESFESNQEFAGYLIGNISKKEIKAVEEKYGVKGINTGVLRNAFAYELSMQEGYVESAKAFNGAIINTLQKFNEGNFNIEAVANIKIALDSAPKELKKQFLANQKDRRWNQGKLDEIEKKRRTAATITSTDPKVLEKARKDLDKYNKEYDRLQEKGRKLVAATRVTLSAIEVKTNTPLSTEKALLEGDPELLSKGLEEIDNQIENIRTSDPKTYTQIKKYSEGYKKALDSARRTTDVLKGFYEADIQLNGSSRTFLNKVVEYNDPTQKVVEQLVNSYKQMQETVLKRDIERNASEGANTTNTDATNKVKKTNENLSPIQEIEAEIERLLEEQGALRSIKSIKDIEETTPTQEEVNEYNALLDKIRRNKKNSTILLSRYRGERTKLSNQERKTSGLTELEVERFKDLSDKLSDFAIANIIGDIENVTIKDLLDQRSNLQQESDSQLLENIDVEQEVVESVDSSFQEASSNNSNRYVNSPDTVMASKKGEIYEIAHLDVEKDPVLFQKIKDSGVPYEITEGKRIRIATEENFNIFLAAFDMKPFTYEGNTNTWMSLFQKNEDGTYTPAQGNFFIESVGDEIINVFSPQELYNKKEGDEIRFAYNPNDAYNQKLQRDGVKGKEFSRQAHIYVTDKKGKVLGSLKMGDDTQANAKINRIRKDFAKNYKKTTEWTVLPFKSSVRKIFTNQPNLEISEEGGLVYKEIDVRYFEENEGVNYKIEGYGIHSNGEIELNGNFSFDTSGVQTSYLGSKKTPTPIIIVKQGNQLIAYPVRVKSADKNYMAQFNAIYNGRDSKVERVKQLQEFAISLGIDPKDFDIYYISDNKSFLESPSFEPKREAFRNEIEKRSTFFTKEDMLSKDTTKEMFAQNVETALDFSNPPFRSPKIEIYENIISTDNLPMEAVEEEALDMESILEKVSPNMSESQIDGFIESQNEATRKAYNNDQDYKTAVREAVGNVKNVPVLKDDNETYENLIESVDIDVLETEETRAIFTKLNGDPINDALVFKEVIEAAGGVISLDVGLLNEDQARAFSIAVATLVGNPSTNTTRGLSNIIDRLTPKEIVKKIVTTETSENLVYYDSKLTEQEVFDKHGLVKTDTENVYERITKTSLDTLYNQTELESTEINEFSQRSGLTEELVLHKIIKNHTVSSLQENKTPELSVEKLEDLKNNFPHRFAKKMNEEKNRNSVAYIEFYSKFKVDRKGVRLKEGVDVESIPERFIEKDIREYSIISKHANFDFSQETISTFDIKTEILDKVNNPSKVPLPSNEVFSTSVEGEVVTKSEGAFIKINNDIYKRTLTDKKSSNAIFKKIKHNANRDFLATFGEVTQTNNSISYLETFDQTQGVINPIEVASNLSGKELDKVNKDDFDCQS